MATRQGRGGQGSGGQTNADTLPFSRLKIFFGGKHRAVIFFPWCFLILNIELATAFGEEKSEEKSGFDF